MSRPIVFFPGIMGSRLYFPDADRFWDIVMIHMAIFEQGSWSESTLKEVLQEILSGDGQGGPKMIAQMRFAPEFQKVGSGRNPPWPMVPFGSDEHLEIRRQRSLKYHGFREI